MSIILFQIRHKGTGQYIRNVKEKPSSGEIQYVFANKFNSRKTFDTIGKAFSYVEEFAPAADVVEVKLFHGEGREGPSCYVIGQEEELRVVQSFIKNTKNPGQSMVRISPLLEKARFFDTLKEAQKALCTIKDINTNLESYYQTREQDIRAKLENPYLIPIKRRILEQNLSGVIEAGKRNRADFDMIINHLKIKQLVIEEEISHTVEKKRRRAF